jgi:Tol biopolymer transport system component
VGVKLTRLAGVLAVTVSFVAAIWGCRGSTSVIDDPIVRSIDAEPQWGPDNKHIAYTHFPQTQSEMANGPSQIWIRTVDSTGSFLTTGASPAWSATGNVLAFVRAGDIWLISVPSRQETQITNLGSCFSPSWSPDGSHVAYKIEANAPLVPADSAGIWIIDVSTRQRRQMTRLIGATPAWSPADTTIAIVAPLAGTPPYDEIALLSVSSGALQRLTFNSVDDAKPAWTPDGGRLLWTQYANGGSGIAGIWTMNGDGTAMRLLISGAAAPSCSHDGLQLAYVARNSATGVQALWIANADGAGTRELPR